ncbi:hypothetical protein R50073_12540 [Maricurvus nonylphenolicus]|uniref:hypothetical protein n=1 Tax=Maricurvus nonylphenolicus TaxID=1008307 RepID=UPI0036F34637
MPNFGCIALLELRGQVVHTYPQGDFDVTSLNEAFENIVKTVAGTERWVLFEHTSANAGLTTSSMSRLMELYTEMAKLGCQGIAIGGDSLFLQIIPNYIPQDFIIPVKVSKDDQMLTAFLESLL